MKQLLQEDSISLEDLIKQIKTISHGDILIKGSWRDYGEHGATCACICVYDLSEDKDEQTKRNPV